MSFKSISSDQVHPSQYISPEWIITGEYLVVNRPPLYEQHPQMFLFRPQLSNSLLKLKKPSPVVFVSVCFLDKLWPGWLRTFRDVTREQDWNGPSGLEGVSSKWCLWFWFSCIRCSWLKTLSSHQSFITEDWTKYFQWTQQVQLSLSQVCFRDTMTWMTEKLPRCFISATWGRSIWLNQHLHS